MRKIVKIQGMHCGHCQAAAEKALNAIEGVTAKVDLKKGQAVVDLKAEISEERLSAAIAEAGFTVTAIAVKKKGLFG